MAEEVASVVGGLSVAEMGDVSVVGASVKNDGGALLRISQAFCGLVDCLLSSLEDFRDVGAVLELETAAGSSELPQSGVSVEESRPELLVVVAGALEEMVGALVSNIKANAEVQKLMPAIEKASVAKHHAFFQELMSIPEHQQSCAGNAISPPLGGTLVCISREDSRTAERAPRSSWVAETADVSAGATAVTQEGGAALLRISLTFYGLADSLLTSVEEFRDVEHTMVLESAAGDGPELLQASVSVEEPRPEDLLVVAGALKGMAGVLVSNIKASAPLQKLMPVLQKASEAKHHDIFEDLMNKPNHRQSRSGNVISRRSEETLACTSSRDSRMAQKRRAQSSAGKGQVTCKHSCQLHRQVLDPCLWGNLPVELEERIFAGLPLPVIVGNLECNKYWHKMLRNSVFRKACSRSHRAKLFGLLGRTVDCETMWTTLYDTESKEWLSIELTGLPGTVPDCRWEPQPENDSNQAYKFSMSASDGGLVCFVPREQVTSLPILVCNPLTSIWKALPLTSVEDFENREIIIVQLVVDDGTKLYKVILVSREKIGEAISAHFYCSETKTWSLMDSGLVHGKDFGFHWGCSVPYMFDCRSKTLFNLSRFTEHISDVLDYSWAMDHLFVLHVSNDNVNGGISVFRHLVSELSWDSSLFRNSWGVTESPVKVFPDPYQVLLFSSSSFVVLISDNCEEWLEDHHQHIGLYDRAAARWEILSPVPRRRKFHYEQLRMSLMVELRWDIDP